MATKIGPKTVTQRDRSKNLVFCIDAAHSDSYGGEPTTNLADNDAKRTLTHHNSGSYGGTQAHADAPEKGPGWKKVTITARGSNLRLCQFPYISQASKTYTYSVEFDSPLFNTGYFWKVDGSSGMSMDTVNGPMAHTKAIKTYTNSSTQDEAIFLCHNTTGTTGLNDVLYYRYYQVEEKSHATPFTEGSRTASNAVTNISGVNSLGTTLTATSTFETYGQQLTRVIGYSEPARKVLKTIIPDQGHIGGAYWDFDGTDEYIITPVGFQVGNVRRKTIAIWVSVDGGVTLVGGTTNANTYKWQWMALSGNQPMTGSGYGTRYYWDSVPTDGAWYHVVDVVDEDQGAGNRVRRYLNGVLQSTTALTTDTGDSFYDGTDLYLYIGAFHQGSGATQFLNGRVANCMIWGDALTAKEVKDIYIAQKGRFGK